MTNGGNAIDWLKEKLGLNPPTYAPPARVVYQVPTSVPVPTIGTISDQGTQASLVGTSVHAKSRDVGGASLISGR